MRTKLWTPLFVVFPVVLTLVSCGSGSSGPRAGTPEWYWQAAQETYASGDYEKAQLHLEEVADGESEYKDRAVVWRAMLSAGLARGYMELGNALAEAMEENDSLAGKFTVEVQDHRRNARRHAINFTESVGDLRQVAQQTTIILDFPFPMGSANEAPALVSLRAGEKVAPAQVDEAVGYTLKRGLLIQASRMAGAGDDVAKGQSAFASGSAEVPQLVFLQAVGRSLFEVSALFGGEQLHEPKILKIMLDNALQCIEPALEAEDEELKKQAEGIKEEIEKSEKERSS